MGRNYPFLYNNHPYILNNLFSDFYGVILLLKLLQRFFSKVISLCIMVILSNIIVFHKSIKILLMAIFYLTTLLFLFDVLILSTPD